MDGTLMTDGGEVAAQIGVHNIVCFGLTNAILATFAFIIFTFICKWWSTNCSHSPF